jgi:hypothetical protein
VKVDHAELPSSVRWMPRAAALPGSRLPGDLRTMGYDVRDLADGQRILAAAIIEKFSLNAESELEPLTPLSTRPVASTVTHTGICKVKGYGFEMKINF